MTSPISQQNTTSLPAASSFAESILKKMPDSLTSMIQNYLPTKQTAQNVHLVARTWQHLWGNDGYLDLSVSSITDDDLARIAEEYKKNGKLTSLNLSHCRNITDKGLEHLAGLYLTQLDLSCCENITEKGLEHLAKLPLTHLDLSCCENITDAGLKRLAKLPLTHLDLSCCQNITDAGLKRLAKLPLTHLGLSNCHYITDAGLKHLAKLSLTQINLSCCDITDAGLEHLSGLPLTKLDLSRCRITTDGLEHLVSLPLTQLNLNCCSFGENTKSTSQFHLIRNYLNQSNQLGMGTLFPNANHAPLHKLIAEYAR